jgi:hypothetical protein
LYSEFNPSGFVVLFMGFGIVAKEKISFWSYSGLEFDLLFYDLGWMLFIVEFAHSLDVICASFAMGCGGWGLRGH